MSRERSEQKSAVVLAGYSGLEPWAQWWLRRAFWVAVAAGAVVAQTACGAWLEVGGARPDLALAAVMTAGLLNTWRGGALLGALCGWCVAALSPPPAWIWPLLYGMAGGVAGVIGQPFRRQSLWLHLAVAAAGAAALGGVVCLVGIDGAPWAQRLGWWWRHAAWTGAWAVPVCVLILRLYRRLP